MGITVSVILVYLIGFSVSLVSFMRFSSDVTFSDVMAFAFVSLLWPFLLMVVLSGLVGMAICYGILSMSRLFGCKF